jgi:uncharacterized protein
VADPRSVADFIEYDGEKLSLTGSRCDACQEVVLAIAPRCANCGSEALERLQLDDHGVVWTYTICHQAGPGSSRPDDVPHVIGLVELAQGLRMVAPLGVPPAALRVGLPVRLAPLILSATGAGPERISFQYILAGA